MSIPRFEILTNDMGGWVRVYLGHGKPTGELALFLSQTLADWVRDPELMQRVLQACVAALVDTQAVEAIEAELKWRAVNRN